MIHQNWLKLLTCSNNYVVCLAVFRADTVTVTDQYQYPDDLPGDEDAFSREPFVVRFKAPRTGQFSDSHINVMKTLSIFSLIIHRFHLILVIKDFVLIPQHTTPTNTTKELDALYDVLQKVREMWKVEVKENVYAKYLC